MSEPQWTLCVPTRADQNILNFHAVFREILQKRKVVHAFIENPESSFSSLYEVVASVLALKSMGKKVALQRRLVVSFISVW